MWSRAVLHKQWPRSAPQSLPSLFWSWSLPVGVARRTTLSLDDNVFKMLKTYTALKIHLSSPESWRRITSSQIWPRNLEHSFSFPSLFFSLVRRNFQRVFSTILLVEKGRKDPSPAVSQRSFWGQNFSQTYRTFKTFSKQKVPRNLSEMEKMKCATSEIKLIISEFQGKNKSLMQCNGLLSILCIYSKYFYYNNYH